MFLAKVTVTARWVLRQTTAGPAAG